MGKYLLNYADTKLIVNIDSDKLSQLFIESVNPYISIQEEINEFNDIEYVLFLDVKRGVINNVPKTSSDVLLHIRGNSKLYGNTWDDGVKRYTFNPHHPAIIIEEGNLIKLIYEKDGIDAYINIHIILFPLWYRLLGKQGALSYHAAAVSRNNEAIMFCGEKGAGKTSCIMDLIFNSNYEFISNDYTMIREVEYYSNEAVFEIIGTPEAIRIGQGTFNCHEKNLVEFEEAPLIADKRQIYLRDFKHLIPIKTISILKSIYLITLNGNFYSKPIRVKCENVLDELMSYNLQVNGFHNPEFLRFSSEIKHTNIETCIKNLCQQVPIYKLDLPLNFQKIGLETFISRRED